MKKDKFLWIMQGTFSVIVLLFISMLVSGQKPVITYHPLKSAALSVYYFLHYTGKWLGWFQLCLAAVTMRAAWRMTDGQAGEFGKAPYRILLSTLAVILSFWIVVWKTGNIGICSAAQTGLQAICLVWFAGNLTEAAGWLKYQSRHVSEKEGAPLKWCAWAALAVLLLSCASVIWAGRFVYPQGDDFEYGIYCYQAWTGNEGLTGVLRGACKMVAEGYGTWQGTFSSIFLMALQPGIWGEKFYHLVPLIMTGLFVPSVFLLFYAVFYKMFHAKKEEVVLIASGVAILAIQLPLSKASAFYWYNGAIHYWGACSFLLYFLSFMLFTILSEKRKVIFAAFSCIAAIFVGGGNLVTALMGVVMTVCILLILAMMKRKRDMKFVSVPGSVMFAAFLTNVLAPGNFVRQAHSGETGQYGVISSILQSFLICLKNAFGEWTDGFWILLLLLLLPVLWSAAKRTDFLFPVPGIVMGASFCLLSAMYTPELFAIGAWRIGRIQNITYIMFLIFTVLNEFYVIGWLLKRHHIRWNHGINVKYYAAVLALGTLLSGLTALGAPEKLTTSAVFAAVRSGEAQMYASAIEENIAVIQASQEELIRIKEPPRKPEIFVNPEIETWRSGAAAYYGKKKIRYYGEREE